ncbi:MAG TPA: hypothetical protein VE954_35680 [Oligoflexus sp.]|uniref:hypothetical protein n=1 Tax=Oligoflexus sp. TaxID=1971216 RepID=UPI002D3187FA|nr:hypothetical protein [Oligoflexus sp.]HYX38474.1 hypothetical protein [Oligoflexus sp.]
MGFKSPEASRPAVTVTVILLHVLVPGFNLPALMLMKTELLFWSASDLWYHRRRYAGFIFGTYKKFPAAEICKEVFHALPRQRLQYPPPFQKPENRQRESPAPILWNNLGHADRQQILAILSRVLKQKIEINHLKKGITNE